MKSSSNLARRNLWNASTRIKASELFMAREEWADVVRECREAIDFSLKGLLHAIGADIPKFQDLGGLLLQSKERFPSGLTIDWERVTRISGIIKESNDSGIFGGGDFMSFGEEVSSEPPALPTREEAEAILSDVRYMEQLGHKVCAVCLPSFSPTSAQAKSNAFR